MYLLPILMGTELYICHFNGGSKALAGRGRVWGQPPDRAFVGRPFTERALQTTWYGIPMYLLLTS